MEDVAVFSIMEPSAYEPTQGAPPRMRPFLFSQWGGGKAFRRGARALVITSARKDRFSMLRPLAEANAMRADPNPYCAVVIPL